MAELCNNFITQFHNLPGVTIKEKQNSLFQLFLQHRPQLSGNEDQLQRITTNLNPTNHLEKIFRIDYLIYFHRFKELYQEFQSSDEITLSKIAKQEWFFQEAFKNLGAEEFVNDILPTMSYTVKLKILKRLSLKEEQNDEIFDAIHKRYGIFLATIFLPKCSSDKISHVLKNHLIKLTPPQLKIIYNKNPDLICIYFEVRTKHEGGSSFMDRNPFLVFLAQTNPEMFAKLFNKYNFNTSLGHRTTKRFLNSQKANVLEKPEPYVEILKKQPLVRKLGHDLKNVLFQTRTKYSEPYWNCLLEHYPKKQRFNLFKATYDKIHHHKFGDNIDTISEDVLKIVSDPLEREKYAKLKLKKEENDKYFEYVTPQYCLNEFAQRLTNMTSAERITFVEVATKCCVLNDDLDSLLKLLELVAVRFKNDDAKIRYEFTCALSNDYNRYSMSILDKFTEQHWKFMIDILATAKAKSEWIYLENCIKIRHVEFLIRHNKPIRPCLTKYAVDSQFAENLRYEHLWKKRPENCRQIITELVEIGAPKSDDEDDAARYDCKLAILCKEFSEKYPKYAIELHKNPRIVKSLKHVLENETDSWGLKGAVEYLICRKDTSEELEELKTLYFQHLKDFGSLEALYWFLKHDPKSLQKYYDDFLVNYVKTRGLNPKRLWRSIKKYPHLEFDKKTVEYCTIKLKEEGFEEKPKLVRALTILSQPEAHLELMKSYLPTSAKVDLDDEEVKDLYAIQCELVKLLNLIASPVTVLPMALQFCKGDYLKVALGPLYSSMYKLPENQTKTYIHQIAQDKAVSVKKHAMNLSCVIYDSATAYDCLKNAQVPSLMPTLKYFGKNPTKTLWELLEQKIRTVEKNDLQIFKWVLKINMPLQYKSKYVEAVWAVLDKYENNQLKKTLIGTIDKFVIQNLNPKFAYQFIEGSIFKIKEANDFISTLLIYINDDGKFELFSKLLALFKEKLWKPKETRRSARRKLHAFVQSLFKTYMDLDKDIDKKQFVIKLSKIFNDVFRPSEALEEYVTVSFMQLKDETPETCSRFLIELTNNLVKDHGKFVINLLASTFNLHVLPLLFKSEIDQMKLCHFVFKFKENADHYLLIIRLLPRTEPEDVARYKLYNEILTDLEEVTDCSVQLQFNLYLKSGDSNDNDEPLSWDRICICPCKE